jgi:hypothetical protein
MTGAIFAQICHILQLDISTIRQLPQAVAGAPTGFASYANLMMLQTFRGQSALDLTTGNEAVGVKALRGPTIPPNRSVERDNVALFWGLLPARGLEGYLRKLVQNIFAKELRMASIDVYQVDVSSAFVEFRSPTILEAFFSGVNKSLSITAGTEDEFPLKAARFEAYERVCRSPLATKELAMAADLLQINEVLAFTADQIHRIESPPEVKHVVGQSSSTPVYEGQTAIVDSNVGFEVGSLEEVVSIVEEEVTAQVDRRENVVDGEAEPNLLHERNIGSTTSGEAALDGLEKDNKGQYATAVDSSNRIKEDSEKDFSDVRALKKRKSDYDVDERGGSSL